jgi:hypothetical protein
MFAIYFIYECIENTYTVTLDMGGYVNIKSQMVLNPSFRRRACTISRRISIFELKLRNDYVYDVQTTCFISGSVEFISATGIRAIGIDGK